MDINLDRLNKGAFNPWENFNLDVLMQVCKSQNAERASSPAIEEETDPGLGFSALHRTFAIPSGYRIKEEPPDHDLLTFQDFLM